jgi:glyoxalase family protein
VGDPADNVATFTEAFGLRLLKRTVNFDDPSTYHLYYGDHAGTPGTAFTVFPYPDGRPGRSGTGEVATTAFAVPPDSLDYWETRLRDCGLDVRGPETRFGERVLPVRDPDGLELELVETADAAENGVEPWADSPVPTDHAIRGFHSVTLRVADADPTAEVLTTLGFEREETAGDRTRFRASGDGSSDTESPVGHARVVDLVERPDGQRAGTGVGSVHHVAFRVSDEVTQREWQERLRDAGHHVTEVKDRRYFRSIYFREPGGVLFELATDGPGFTADESVESLGSELRLPPWLADDRADIERSLPSLEVSADV